MTSKHLRERNDEIARLYAEGALTLREIGERFALSRERVRQIAGRAGVTPRALREDVPERNQEIIRLYGQGLEVGEIAARVHLSRSRVYEIVRAAGVPLGRPGRLRGWRHSALAKRNEDIIHAYDQGKLSLAQVGALFGLNPTTVSDILREAGVSRRKPSPSRLNMAERNQEAVLSHDPIKSAIGDMRQRTLEIVHLYVDKVLSLREVATCVGLSAPAVRETLERAGVSRRSASGPRLSLMQRNEEIARLYREEGLTHKEIGARMDLSLQHVQCILKGLGVRGSQRGSAKPAA